MTFINSVELNKIASEMYQEKVKKRNWKEPFLVGLIAGVIALLFYIAWQGEQITEMKMQLRTNQQDIQAFKDALRLEYSQQDIKFKGGI